MGNAYISVKCVRVRVQKFPKGVNFIYSKERKEKHANIYVVLICRFCCSLKNSFFVLVSFQDVVSFLKVPFGLGALFFFSLFCVVSHYLCGCVCVFSFFFLLSRVVVRKKLSIETRARVVAKKREISFGDESREEETKECGPE